VVFGTGEPEGGTRQLYVRVPPHGGHFVRRADGVTVSALRLERRGELLQQASQPKTRLAYNEPRTVSRAPSAGRQLLLAGRPRKAEQVYREDLRRHPKNGWALQDSPRRSRRRAEPVTPSHDARSGRRVAARGHYSCRVPAFWFAGADTTDCACQHQASGERQPGRVLLRAQYKAGVD